MINRLNQVKDGGYSRLHNDSIREIRVSVMEDMGPEIRNSNNTLEDIKENQKIMKKIINDYNKQPTARQQKNLLQQFNNYQQENREAFGQLKNNIDRMNDAARTRGKSDKKTKYTQILKFQVEMQQCLKIQLEQSVKVKNVVEQKKQRLEKDLPKGVTLGSLETLIMGNSSAKVKNAAQDLKDKMNELQRLAASVKQCRQLMNDIAFYVQTGTQQLKMVTDNVQDAQQNLKKGNENIILQKKRVGRSRKIKCIIIIVAVLVLAAVGIVLYKFVPWS